MIPAHGEKRPKVLFLAPYFPPTFYGGVVQVYLGLLERLKGFEVTVLADRHHSSVQQIETWDAQATRELPIAIRRLNAFELHLPQTTRRGLLGVLFSLVSKARAAFSFFREGRREWDGIVQRHRPDIVVCGGTYSAGWLTVTLPRSVPLVNYIHGEELTMRMKPHALTACMRRFQLQSIRRAVLNIAVSDYTARLTQTLARVDAAKVTVLPNFIDTRRFHRSERREALREARGWTNRCVVLTIARLEQRKGIDQALRALALLREHGRVADDWIYVIAGRGQQQRALEELVQQLRLTDHVSFLGFVQDDDVVELYQAADVFVQPNREINGDTEGFGIVFLEANACGLPVVGGTAGGTAAAIKDGVSGYRVNGDSVEAIASALERLVRDAALREMLGRQGAARVMSHFTVERAAAQFENLLRGVLALPKAAGDVQQPRSGEEER